MILIIEARRLVQICTVLYKNNVVDTEDSLAHHGIQLCSVAELVFFTKAGAELSKF